MYWLLLICVLPKFVRVLFGVILIYIFIFVL
nr:MAG TPA: hypothetical protein [Caudoviricetes sp.]